MAKKNKLKVTVDTSTCEAVKAKLHKDLTLKLTGWQGVIDAETPSKGSRKGINSILTKATNKSKQAVEKFEKAKEARQEKQKAKEVIPGKAL